jgi:hypothetical protein
MAAPAASLLAACEATRTSRAAAPPRRGGSLVFGTEAEITSFDARVAAWDSTGLLYARTVYDPLCVQAATARCGRTSRSR